MSCLYGSFPLSCYLSCLPSCAQRKLVHADLNARNVMIENENLVRLIDFGEAVDLSPYVNRSNKVSYGIYTIPPSLHI